MAPPRLRFSHMGVFVRDAARMRDFYRRAMVFVVSDEAELGGARLTGRSHGNAWSIYFCDPEGNRIEAFVDSPWHVAQPISEPFDILQSDEAALVATEAWVMREPSWRPRAELAARLQEE